MIHTIKRNSGGRNESGWIQNICSFGWEGKPHYAYDDYQHSNCAEESREHMRTTKALKDEV